MKRCCMDLPFCGISFCLCCVFYTPAYKLKGGNTVTTNFLKHFVSSTKIFYNAVWSFPLPRSPALPTLTPHRPPASLSVELHVSPFYKPIFINLCNCVDLILGCLGYKPCQGEWPACQGTYLSETWLSLSLPLPGLSSSSARGGACWDTLWSELSQVLPNDGNLLHLPCFAWKTQFPCSQPPPLALPAFLPTPLEWSPGRDMHDLKQITPQSPSLCVLTIWVSLLIAISCKEALL